MAEDVSSEIVKSEMDPQLTATSQHGSDMSSQPAPPTPMDEAFVTPDYAPEVEIGGGVRCDFSLGLRMYLPPDKASVHVTVMDRLSGALLMDNVLKPGYGLVSPKKYYMDYMVLLADERTHARIATHVLDLEGRDVLVQLPMKGALGDSIAWFSAVPEFGRRHKCRLHVLMDDRIRGLFERQYPDIMFENKESARKLRPYASYYLGLFFKGDTDWQPVDFRLLGLAQQAASILGIPDMDISPPLVDLTAPRAIQDRYVVVATQASCHAKCWNNPSGWRILAKYLTSCGYRVLCIDKSPETGSDNVWHTLPNGVEDFTGNLPLQERVDIIKDADAFVGLSSGLSWVAWCCRTPQVLISGICMPFGEFQTPYRVQARHVCHGCWNDTRYEFDHTDYMWCPRNKGTGRAYECTKFITAKMVIDTFSRIPGVLGGADGGREQEDMA